MWSSQKILCSKLSCLSVPASSQHLSISPNSSQHKQYKKALYCSLQCLSGYNKTVTRLKYLVLQHSWSSHMCRSQRTNCPAPHMITYYEYWSRCKSLLTHFIWVMKAWFAVSATQHSATAQLHANSIVADTRSSPGCLNLDLVMSLGVLCCLNQKRV